MPKTKNNTLNERTATLSFSDGTPSVELPILYGTLGADTIDFRTLYGQTGKFSYDPGFMSTASCRSSITYIDGEKGELLYRGYPIEQLAAQCDYLEVSHLLLRGELPTKEQKKQFEEKINRHTMLHEQIGVLYSAFRRDAHPMAVMIGITSAFSAFFDYFSDQIIPSHRDASAIRLLAKIPTVAAMAYKYSIGQPFIYPRNDLGYTENFLRMMFATPAEDYKSNPVLVRALDRILILHADHEQNASTTAVRLVGSAGANMFASMAAGIACLWGPAHGGANEACLKMLQEIGDVSRVDEFIQRAKKKGGSFRLMGFGHRVYKNYDPRAKLMRETTHEVLEELGLKNDPLFKLAIELEKIALEDEYFIERKLYPNVDFYSGIVLQALGIPPAMFTAIFAMARMTGWIAQWSEMVVDPEQRIGRPRQIYEGVTRRDVIPIEQRSQFTQP